MESHTVPSDASIRVDALETFVELLSRVEADPSSDAFYSRLCEATCRLAGMDRAVIFRYDSARRRVGAAARSGRQSLDRARHMLGIIFVEVVDRGGGFTAAERTRAIDEPGGYGLFLVGALADRWGVDSDGCTTVWFELETG